MSIREASVGDLDAIREVARTSWETDYPRILSRETVEEGIEEWYAAERLREEFDDERTRIHVAVAADAVVGFAHAVANEDGVGYVLRLYVEPEHRRDGVGRRLLEAARDALFAEGVDRVEAMVLADNDLGNAFYRDMGFEKVAEADTTIGDAAYRENTYALERE